MSEEHDDNPEKKIIIDEDWKSKVQAEKEAAAESKSAQQPAAGAAEAKPAAADPKLPPASFEFLLETLATQAMAALGLMPDPISHKAERRLNLARHMIDTLDMLQAKTTGNLSGPESQMLESLLHQLRLAYVTVSSAEPA